MARGSTALGLAVVLCALPLRVQGDDAGVRAQAVVEASEKEQTPAQMLQAELALLDKKHLAEPNATSIDQLSALLEDAHARALSGRKDEATLLLLEAVEGPRFRSFEAFDTFAAAELMLASLLLDQHALLSAQRSVDRLLARGAQSSTFGPAYRRAIDIALARTDYGASAAKLRAEVKEPLPADAQSELHYLTALAAYDVPNLPEAQRELSAVRKKSRFYGRSQYLLGALAAAQKKYDEASARFCAARDVDRGAPRTRYESAYLYPSEDLARMGLARVAHEQGRDKQAFDYYFTVPNDSPLVAEALFESAYASYEQGHPRTALDSLAQLEARYPQSAYTAEARVLRGYVHLASCDFERAERELVSFEQTFGSVLTELASTLESPASTHGLFEEHDAARQSKRAPRDSLLLGLVTRDPEVEHLRAQLDGLDAELARGSRVPEQFTALAARVRGKEAPRARPSEQADDATRIALLRARATELHAALTLLSRDLSVLSRAGDKSDELRALRASQRKLQKRTDAVEAGLRHLLRKQEYALPPPAGTELAERLEQESTYVDALRTRALELRDRLAAALARAERRALETLRARLEKELRRARIGRIDAVMGKKRKLELEVESLSAGRFPAELSSQKQTPVLLSDDQEYWPFEGEDWPDEYREQP